MTFHLDKSANSMHTIDAKPKILSQHACIHLCSYRLCWMLQYTAYCVCKKKMSRPVGITGTNAVERLMPTDSVLVAAVSVLVIVILRRFC